MINNVGMSGYFMSESELKFGKPNLKKLRENHEELKHSLSKFSEFVKQSSEVDEKTLRRLYKR